MIATNDHTLNACLARVADIEISEGKANNDTVWFLTEEWVEEGWDEFTEWNPLHDANQMEKVKEALKCRGVEYVITSAHLVNVYVAEMILADGVFDGKDKSELRAFALAVYAMDQSQKGMT